MKFLRQFAARIVGQSIRIFCRAITAVRADVDIFPYQRRIEADVDYTMVNESREPIREMSLRPTPCSTTRLPCKDEE